MQISTEPALNDAMDRLWDRFRPQIEERVMLLEHAASSLAEGSLSLGQCADASSAAHKLAGVLGTFGLEEGTELAREAEALYGAGLPADEANRFRMAEVAARLRAMVASRR